MASFFPAHPDHMHIHFTAQDDFTFERVHITGDKVWMMLMNDLPAQTAINSASDPEQGTALKLRYNVTTEQVLFLLYSDKIQ